MNIQTIGIVGLGLMGRSIASCALGSNLRVIAHTLPASAYPDARAAITADIEDLIAHDAAPASLRDSWPARYTEAPHPDALRDCDFIIETITEDLPAKRAVYDHLESILPPTTPIASNTSAIPITLLQQGRLHPARFIGMHFCPPVHVSQFLEVIRGEHTDDPTTAAALALGRQLGKDPGLVKIDVPGFVINRLAYALFREATHLLDTGVADAHTIDTLFKHVVGTWTGAVGPLGWMDLTGLPAYAHVFPRLLPTLSTSSTTPPSLQRLLDAGHTGADAHQGFHPYTPAQTAHLRALIQRNAWTLRQHPPLPPP